MNPFSLGLGDDLAGYLAALLLLLKGIPTEKINAAIDVWDKMDGRAVMIDPAKETGRAEKTWGEVRVDYIKLLDHLAYAKQHLEAIEKLGGPRL